MKSKLLIIAAAICALLVVAPDLQAQQYSAGSLTVTVTGNTTLGAGNATTENATITTTKKQKVAIQLTATGASADQAGNLTASFSASLDGTSWSPAFDTVVLATSGNSTVTKVDTIDVGAVGYLKLASLTNSSNGTVSNVAVKYTTAESK